MDQHRKLVLAKSGEKEYIDGLIWNFGDAEPFDQNEKYSFVMVPQLNTFNGNTKVQVIINDYKLSTSKSITQSTHTPITGTVVPKQAKPETTKPNSDQYSQTNLDGDKATNWIDHRSRDSIESFMGQLMMPKNDESL